MALASTIRPQGDIKTNLPEVSAALDSLSKSQAKKAIAAALNRTLDAVYTRVVRAVSDEAGVKQKAVRAVTRKYGASSSRLYGEIYSRDRFLPLKAFTPSVTQHGVSAAPWGIRRLFPRTFIGPGGHVFRRLAGERKIKKLWGPAIPREMIRGASARIVPAVVAEVFPKRLQHEIERALAQAKETANV